MKNVKYFHVWQLSSTLSNTPFFGCLFKGSELVTMLRIQSTGGEGERIEAINKSRRGGSEVQLLDRFKVDLSD